MAADLVTTMRLEDKRVRGALRKIESEAGDLGKAFRRVSKVDGGVSADELVAKFATVDFAVQASKRIVDGAVASVTAYAERFPRLASGASDAADAMEAFSTSIGRDLIGFLDQGAGLIGDFLGLVDSVRTDLVNAIVDPFGSRGQEIDRLRLLAERQEIAFDQQVRAGKERQALEQQIEAQVAERLAAEGRLAEAQQVRDNVRKRAIEAELVAERERIAQLAEEGEISSEQADALQEVAGERARAARAALAAAAAARQNAAALAEEAAQTQRLRDSILGQLEAAARRDERAAARAAREQEVRDALELARIDTLRLEGRDREAQLAEQQLRQSQQRRELERDTTLSVEQRARALERLAGLQARQRDALAARLGERIDLTRDRSAGVGLLGGAQLNAQQLGLSAQRSTADAALAIQRQLEQLIPQQLRDLIEAVRLGQLARFG